MKSGQPWEPQQIVAFLDGKGEDKVHPEMMNISKNDDHALKFLRRLPKPTLNACLVIAAKNMRNETFARNSALLVAAGANNLEPLKDITKDLSKKDQYLNYLLQYRASESDPNLPAITHSAQPPTLTPDSPLSAEYKQKSKPQALYEEVSATAPNQVTTTVDVIKKSEHRHDAYLLAATKGDLWACYLFKLGGAQHDNVNVIFSASSPEAIILGLIPTLRDLGTTPENIKELLSFTNLSSNELTLVIRKFDPTQLQGAPQSTYDIYKNIHNRLSAYREAKFKPISIIGYFKRDVISRASLPLIYITAQHGISIIDLTITGKKYIQFTTQLYNFKLEHNRMQYNNIDIAFQEKGSYNIFRHEKGRLSVFNAKAYQANCIYVIDLGSGENIIILNHDQKYHADIGGSYSLILDKQNDFQVMYNNLSPIMHPTHTNISYPVKSVCAVREKNESTSTGRFAMLRGSSQYSMLVCIYEIVLSTVISKVEVLKHETSVKLIKTIPVPNAEYITRLNDTQLVAFCNPPGLVVVDIDERKAIRLNIAPEKLHYHNNIQNLQISHIDAVNLLFRNGDEYAVLNCSTQTLDPISLKLYMYSGTSAALTSEGVLVCCMVTATNTPDTYSVQVYHYQQNFWLIKYLTDSLPSSFPTLLLDLILGYCEYEQDRTSKVSFFPLNKQDTVDFSQMLTSLRFDIKKILQPLSRCAKQGYGLFDLFNDSKKSAIKSTKDQANRIKNELQEILSSPANKEELISRMLAAHEYLQQYTRSASPISNQELSVALQQIQGKITGLIQQLGAEGFLTKTETQTPTKQL